MVDAMGDQARATVEAIGQNRGVPKNRPSPPKGGAMTDTSLNRRWSNFLRARPLPFKGVYDPLEAKKWLREMEKVFIVLHCTHEQNVAYVVHMLTDDAKFWWRGMQQILISQGTPIT